MYTIGGISQYTVGRFCVPGHEISRYTVGRFCCSPARSLTAECPEGFPGDSGWLEVQLAEYKLTREGQVAEVAVATAYLLNQGISQSTFFFYGVSKKEGFCTNLSHGELLHLHDVSFDLIRTVLKTTVFLQWREKAMNSLKPWFPYYTDIPLSNTLH